MWESGLGEFTGEFRVMNIFLSQIALMDKAEELAIHQLNQKGEDWFESSEVVAKQAKLFHKRRNNALQNIAALLRRCKAGDMDPFVMKGSWGGAIGYPQFIPASLKFAVDGDNDGVIDLHTWPDAVMSVANYLAEHGYSSNRWRAIFRYNPNKTYVAGVMKYAKAIKRKSLR